MATNSMADTLRETMVQNTFEILRQSIISEDGYDFEASLISISNNECAAQMPLDLTIAAAKWSSVRTLDSRVHQVIRDALYRPYSEQEVLDNFDFFFNAEFQSITYAIKYPVTDAIWDKAFPDMSWKKSTYFYGRDCVRVERQNLLSHATRKEVIDHIITIKLTNNIWESHKDELINLVVWFNGDIGLWPIDHEYTTTQIQNLVRYGLLSRPDNTIDTTFLWLKWGLKYPYVWQD